jgi:hypothetical protein
VEILEICIQDVLLQILARTSAILIDVIVVFFSRSGKYRDSTSSIQRPFLSRFHVILQSFENVMLCTSDTKSFMK